MSKSFKHALQAAAIVVAILLGIDFILFGDLVNCVMKWGDIDVILSLSGLLVIPFVIVLVFWWKGFTSESFQPLRAAWIGTLVVVVTVLFPVWMNNCLSNNCTLQHGRLENGGGLEAIAAFLLIAGLIPVAAVVSMVIRWFQTRKVTASSSSCKSGTIIKRLGLAVLHLFALLVVLAVTFSSLIRLTNDYVGIQEEQEIAKNGYQLNQEIEGFYKRNGSYPESLTELPSADGKEFNKYRKWSVFHYASNGRGARYEYRLLWKYELSRAVICSNNMSFWPGAASIRTEDMPMPIPNSQGCYEIDPNNINEPPLVH